MISLARLGSTDNIYTKGEVMSVDTKRISNEAAIPQLTETSVFAERPEARFALGVIAHATDPDERHRNLFQAYLRLRANVYIDQTDMLHESHRRADGTELDGDDERSTHIVALENRLSHVAVVASMRVIEKTAAHDSPLPLEDFFGSRQLPIGSNEISRYINRHDDRRHAAAIRNGLFLTALAHIHASGLSPTVAVVEPELEERLARIGVPIRRIGQPKFVEEYNETNLGLEIDTGAFAEQFGGDSVMRAVDTSPGAFVYWGQVEG